MACTRAEATRNRHSRSILGSCYRSLAGSGRAGRRLVSRSRVYIHRQDIDKVTVSTELAWTTKVTRPRREIKIGVYYRREINSRPVGERGSAWAARVIAEKRPLGKQWPR